VFCSSGFDHRLSCVALFRCVYDNQTKLRIVIQPVSFAVDFIPKHSNALDLDEQHAEISRQNQPWRGTSMSSIWMAGNGNAG
jgi:hypothetical protein